MPNGAGSDFSILWQLHNMTFERCTPKNFVLRYDDLGIVSTAVQVSYALASNLVCVFNFSGTHSEGCCNVNVG
jgi:hypothetical protein